MPDSIETHSLSAAPRDYFSDMHTSAPGTLGGIWLRRFWHPIARAIEVKPGRAQPVHVLNEHFTLYRSQAGEVHLTQYRCPHRGTTLSVGLVEGDSIRCHSHAWKFGADGVCTERPGEPNGGGGGIKIRTYPVREFLGLVYGYFGDDAPPAFPPYPGFSGEGLIETQVTKYACNYFQSWENDWDLFHASSTHQTGEIHGPAPGAERLAMYLGMLHSEQWEETEYGCVRRMSVMNGVNASILLMPHTVRLLIPTFNEQSRRTGPAFRETYIAHTPIDDESHLFFIAQLVPVTGQAAEEYLAEYNKVLAIRAAAPSSESCAEKILAGEKYLDDYLDHPMLVEIEDMIAQAGQGAIADRHAEQLGRSDVGVMLLRRVMARELQAVAEGRPTKNWAFMAELPEGATTLAFDPATVPQTIAPRAV